MTLRIQLQLILLSRIPLQPLLIMLTLTLMPVLIIQTPFPEKIESKTDQAIGSVKEPVSHAVGNNALRSQGIQQNAAGHGTETAHNLAGFFQKMANEVQGTFKVVFNAFSGSNKK
ncbi:unnamed protein product [Mucor circinelloides]